MGAVPRVQARERRSVEARGVAPGRVRRGLHRSPSASSSERSACHAQALRHINTFTNIWDAGLVLFGLNLFVLAYLAYRSGYVPKLLGVLLAIAGFGYVFDTVVRALVRGSSSDVSAITGMGEFVFALWLVIRGRRITVSDSGSHDNSIGAAR